MLELHARLTGGASVVVHGPAGIGKSTVLATYLSVKAIEAKLTRLYRRHGVRNRAQLMRALEHAPPGRTA